MGQKTPQSPFTLLILLLVSVVTVETVVMLLLPELLRLSAVGYTLLDIVALASLLFPVLYFFVFRPMSQNIAEREKAAAEIRAESSKNEALLRTAGDGIHVLDLAGNLVQANDAFCRMLGFAPKELTGLNAALWDEHWPDRYQATSGGTTFESRQRRRNGSTIDVEINAVGVEIAGQQLLFCAARDITTRKAVEARQQLAANVFRHTREGIIVTDTAGTILEVNDTFSRITGFGRDEILGKNTRVLNSGRQSREYYTQMWRALGEEGHWCGEIWNRRKDGEVYAEMLTISAVRDASGTTQNYVALFTDITPMKEQQKQLERIAHYDTLTGLPNRVLLADRLQQAMSQSQRHGRSLAVAYLDLDGFKAVNDTHGHNIGDELLIAIARRMKSALREGDTLARIGGDEFAAVLVNLEAPQDCDPVLLRFLETAATPALVNGITLEVSASIGATIYPQDGANAEQLLRHADQSMYLAKQAGKNRYHLFDVGQDAEVKSRRQNIEEIGEALTREEFELFYQPKVNMKSGKIIGAEALVRWRHPVRGLLSPAEFLHLIEDHPLGVELGKWVMNAALRQIEKWHFDGLEIPVSVNIGGRQLLQSDFVDHLTALLAKYPAVPPNWLELEILETSALEDMAQVSRIMHACRAIGVHFALDDFGTGYSSLTYLKYLPAEVLKIDQSFVRDMLDDSDDLSIVEGVVGLSSAFRRKVIAEGVESVPHGELLLMLGCELAQGFGIARPMPATDFPAWAANWRPDASWTAMSGYTPNRDDLMVAFAEVKHRHWLRDIGAYLAGQQEAPPPMEAHECHFGRWQGTEGRARFGDHPEFGMVVDLHNRVHALGRKLLRLHHDGEHAKIERHLHELHSLRDELIAGLRRLLASAGRRGEPA